VIGIPGFPSIVIVQARPVILSVPPHEQPMAASISIIPGRAPFADFFPAISGRTAPRRVDVTPAPALRKTDLTRKFHEAGRLLNQQLWYWGQDIQRSEGNLLIAYGLTRIAPPADKGKCPAIYQFKSGPHGQSIMLRGFGIWYQEGSREPLFWRRYKPVPQRVIADSADQLPWLETDLPLLATPRICQELNVIERSYRQLCHWIANYESWIARELPPDYRTTTLTGFRGQKPFPPESMEQAWRALGAFETSAAAA